MPVESIHGIELFTSIEWLNIIYTRLTHQIILRTNMLPDNTSKPSAFFIVLSTLDDIKAA